MMWPTSLPSYTRRNGYTESAVSNLPVSGVDEYTLGRAVARLEDNISSQRNMLLSFDQAFILLDFYSDMLKGGVLAFSFEEEGDSYIFAAAPSIRFIKAGRAQVTLQLQQVN